VFVESYEGVLLAGEFDGHGHEGEPVVAFCKRFAVQYLKENVSAVHSDPAQFLISLNENCDKALKKAVDCKGSGSTAVMMLYADGFLTFSCVGDSRAVIATTDPHRGFTQPPRREDKQLLEAIKSRRHVAPEQALTAEQVTQDQKPEDPGELKRIKAAGGCVMRLEDDHGKKVGPYRVWKVEGTGPGIAMSRSLGDVIAHEIGVISTPAITSHVESAVHDYFIVLASDGVWDVMENQEVCDFVEAFRNKSLRNVSIPRSNDVVCPDNVTIAQLLCEEARVRWLSIVAAEDVIIDDISCVIMELQILAERKSGMPQRIQTVREVEDVPGLEEAVKKGRVRPNDPRRNSTVTTEMPTVPTDTQAEPERRAVVKDPRRSSIASS
jgi:serine/threonine protein phosphatase PrpC